MVQNRCCQTCDDVKRAYKLKNWDFHPFSIEQCKNQSSQSGMYDNAFKEGCQMYGTLQVNRVSIEEFYKMYIIYICILFIISLV